VTPHLLTTWKLPFGGSTSTSALSKNLSRWCPDVGDGRLLGLERHAVRDGHVDRLGRRVGEASLRLLRVTTTTKRSGLPRPCGRSQRALSSARTSGSSSQGVEARVLGEERRVEIRAVVGPALLPVHGGAAAPRRAVVARVLLGPRSACPSRGGADGASPAGFRNARRSRRSGAPPGPARSSRCGLSEWSRAWAGASLSLAHWVPKLKPCNWLKSILLKSAVGLALDASSSM